MKLQADFFYHIYNRVNGTEYLFRNEGNYRYFLELWQKYIDRIAGTFAYCLMPTHFHSLIKLKSAEALKTYFERQKKIHDKERLDITKMSDLCSKQFSNLFNAYSKAYNKMYERNGSLFQRPFKAKIIQNEKYLKRVIVYIHQNPVHHGYTSKVDDWPFCGYTTLISTKPTRLERDRVISLFGNMEEMTTVHQHCLKEYEKIEMEFT